MQDALLALPELPTILTYHILPGKYLTNDMYNNTPIYTCLGAVQVRGPCRASQGKSWIDGNVCVAWDLVGGTAPCTSFPPPSKAK
jgi:hypothetical protein